MLCFMEFHGFDFGYCGDVAVAEGTSMVTYEVPLPCVAPAGHTGAKPLGEKREKALKRLQLSSTA